MGARQTGHSCRTQQRPLTLTLSPTHRLGATHQRGRGEGTREELRARIARFDEDGGALFPSWRRLLTDGADRLAAARRLRDGLAEWDDFLHAALDVARKDVDEESLALARAVWGLGSRLVVTTNYDRVLEWACLPGTRDDLDVWDVENVAGQARLLREGAARAPTLWHLHGRVRNVAGLVLTPDGYRRLYGSKDEEERHRAALQTLGQLLASHTFLFVGFSFDDEHVGFELRGVRALFEGFSATHYALVRPRDVDAVRGLGVEPIPFDDFEELPGLLAEIARQGAEAPPAPDEPRPADWSAYLEALIEQTDHINVRGISTSTSRQAPRHPIERLYTPLRSRDLRRRHAVGELAEGFESPVSLAELLPRHRRLLIEGQPGAGKTTFLRFVASMLARDAAGRPGPGGTTWRERYLGLGEHELPPTPVLVRLADLVPLLEKDGALRKDDRRWLLDLLEGLCRANDFPIPREAWQAAVGGAVVRGGEAGDGGVSLGRGGAGRRAVQL